MIALIERKLEGHIDRPMCVVSQGTLQTFVNFYVGHFPIELSKKNLFWFMYSSNPNVGVKVIYQKNRAWKG
jgi:hypothetical protein